MLGRVAKSVKNSAIAAALRAYVNDKFGEYGEVMDCSVDTEQNRLTVLAKLKGERDTVSATLERYEILREGDKVFIKLHGFSSSRAWLTLLLNKLLSGKRYPLPSAVASLL
ncbi:MAG TPA: hypothetical protein VGE57_07075 [Solimonas sp.]